MLRIKHEPTGLLFNEHEYAGVHCNSGLASNSGLDFKMTYKLTATITHRSFEKPLVKEFVYHGETKDDIMDQIETLPCHKHNLKLYGRTAFKSTDGVKHSWVLKKVKEPIDLN